MVVKSPSLNLFEPNSQIFSIILSLEPQVFMGVLNGQIMSLPEGLIQFQDQGDI
jgi:hypothetical protein